jgi:hypothetical protein
VYANGVKIPGKDKRPMHGNSPYFGADKNLQKRDEKMSEPRSFGDWKL